MHHVIQTAGLVALIALATLAAFKGADLAEQACVAARPFQGRVRCAVQALAAFALATAASAAATLTACA